MWWKTEWERERERERDGERAWGRPEPRCSQGAFVVQGPFLSSGDVLRIWKIAKLNFVGHQNGQKGVLARKSPNGPFSWF